MVKYHNSKDGPRICRTKTGTCPYSRAGDNHYATQAEAQVAYDKKMSEAFGVTPSVGRVESVRQKAYRGVDAVTQEARVIKANAVEARQRVIKSLKRVKNPAVVAQAREVLSYRQDRNMLLHDSGSGKRKVDLRATAVATGKKGFRKMSSSMSKLFKKASSRLSSIAFEVLEIKYKTDNVSYRQNAFFTGEVIEKKVNPPISYTFASATN